MSQSASLSATQPASQSISQSPSSSPAGSPTAAPPRDAANWFEIPSTNFERAVAFYEKLLDITLQRATFGDPMAVFPSDQKGVGGAIVHRPQHQAGASGALIYLNADGILDEAVVRAPWLGGSVLVATTPVPGGFGSYACIVDTEGNHIGLHQH